MLKMPSVAILLWVTGLINSIIVAQPNDTPVNMP